MISIILSQVQEFSELARTGTKNIEEINNPILSILLVVLLIFIIALSYVIYKQNQNHRKDIGEKDLEIKELNKLLTNNAVENLKTMKDYEANLDRTSQTLQVLVEKNEDLHNIIRINNENTKFLTEWVKEKYFKN